MVTWKIVFTKQAIKDSKNINRSGLKEKVQELLKILAQNPYTTPPSYKKLVGDLSGAYSRRITIQHRLVYQVLTEQKTIKIIRMWTHYE